VAEQSIASAEEYGASLEQAGLQLDGEVGAKREDLVSCGVRGQEGERTMPRPHLHFCTTEGLCSVKIDGRSASDQGTQKVGDFHL
jgi:hypothetical protein